MRAVFIDIAVYEHLLGEPHKYIHRMRRIASDLVTEDVTGVPLPGGKIAISRGLFLLASAMKRLGADVSYLHFARETFESMALAFTKSDLVCFYAMTPTAPICLQLAKLAKQFNPRIIVAMGGPHVTSQAKDIISTENVNFVSFGNASPEQISKALLRDISWQECPGVAFRIDGQNQSIEVNAPDPFQKGDDIEFVDYSILPLPLDKYYFNISGSHGCVYSCNFCSDGERSLKLRSIDDLLSEIVLLDSELPEGSWVHFFDTIFTVPPNRAAIICERLAKETKRLSFSCDIKAKHLSEELARKMRDARFRFVSMGFETSDDSVLEVSNKQNSFSDCCKTANTLKSTAPDCAIKAYWLLGLPGSSPRKTEYDLVQIARILDERIVDIVGPKCFVPYPETPFFKNPDRFGLKVWSTDWSQYDRFHLPPVSTPIQFTREQLSSYLIQTEQLVLTKYCERLDTDESNLATLKASPKRYNGELYSRLI
jgi:anaerobic magnesium-protoporphyrin IX monomethyl ester cyclase